MSHTADLSGPLASDADLAGEVGSTGDESTSLVWRSLPSPATYATLILSSILGGISIETERVEGRVNGRMLKTHLQLYTMCVRCRCAPELYNPRDPTFT